MITFWTFLHNITEERQQAVSDSVLQAYDSEFKRALTDLIQRTKNPDLRAKFVDMMQCPLRDSRGKCRGFSEYIVSCAHEARRTSSV